MGGSVMERDQVNRPNNPEIKKERDVTKRHPREEKLLGAFLYKLSIQS
jgi:hypothetical protein